MGLELTVVLTGTILIIFLYLYLRIVYECIRKVHITKIQQPNKKSLTAAVAAATNKTCDLNKISPISVTKTTMTAPPTTTTQTMTMTLKQAPGPLPWPVLGNLALLGQYAVPFQGFTELAKQFGDVYSLTLGTTRCLVVNNLELIREVLNQNGKYFGGRPDFLRFHKLFGGNRNNSLALCDWSQLQQKRRNLARKHCSPRDASAYYSKMSEVGCFEIEEFMARLEQIIIPGQDYQFKPLIQQTCANLFIKYMCSIRFDYDDVKFQGIVRSFDEIFWEINQGYAVDFLPWLVPFYSGHMKKIVNWSTMIRKFILERIINERERHIDVDKPEVDFTDALLKVLAEDGDVERETIIFMLEDFIGGHSAVGNLVTLALAYILRNPEVAEKIQNEVDSIAGSENRRVTMMDMENMPYTVATIYEVLRYCSSPIVPHVATEDVAIAGYGVTKGTIVFVNNYELNTSERYWNQPEKFLPERFIEPVSQSQAKPNQTSNQVPKYQIRKNIPHFLPFSIGKRTCIGQNLVKGFGFVMVANILQKYDISCSDVNSIKTYPACVAVPPDTYSMCLTPRKNR
ncbi:cytochrome P450 307a1-like [Eupeodes corollae]|uniref:cytochrome P450 307a1-like n=1 Tax=Eupeodes corollae TaxID=290404 RepID=UPI00249355D7|nr:cytochrome P450 307a1-like [Eupeodes corollae]